jgi:hypothetical protein
MTTLNQRAQKIRNEAASALDDQQRDEVVQRAVALAGKLNQTAALVAKANGTVRTLIDLGVVARSSTLPSDRHLRTLITKAEKQSATLPEFVLSALPGELELGAGDYTRSLESAAKEAWQQYASERAASIGAESELLETALGSIPRFKSTIEQTRRARLKVNLLLRTRELPSADEIREFQDHLEALEEANREFEREVPPEFRDTLRQCATRTGVSPANLPDGFVEWIDKVGAQGYFKVTLSDL